MAVCGHGIGQQICDALGLSTHQIRRLVIDIAVDDVVLVYVQKLLDEKEVEPLCDVLTAHKEKIEFVECDAPIVISERGDIRVHEE